MKIIFSRKGYDTTSGGFPSPIFPDGTLYSLPIPSNQDPSLEEVRLGNTNLGIIVEQLTQQYGIGEEGVHLDPDLDRHAVKRKKGWLPCLGQVGASQTHLDHQQVGKGDLFLFFGWFRETMGKDGCLHYKRGAKDIHSLFGWLQVGEIYHPSTGNMKFPKWAASHPHIEDAEYYPENNTLYVATEQLRIPYLKRHISGGGIFGRFSDDLCLTERGKKRSTWRLPSYFYPQNGIPPLTYHSNLSRWKKDKKGILLEAVGRGQEFVLDCDFYPDVIQWLRDLFKNAPTSDS